MRGPRTLVARVAWSTAAAIAIAGIAVALVSNLLAGRLLRARDDAHLASAARTLALELEEPGADVGWVVRDETRELTGTGIVVAVYDEHRNLVEGASPFAFVERETCARIGNVRGCAAGAGRWTALAYHDTAALAAQSETLALASGIAVLLTALLGALTAVWVARFAVAPLSRLRAAIAAPPARDGRIELGDDEGVAEIDALRASLRATLDHLDDALSQARRFSRDAAHELRTPLTTMLGELDLAAERVVGEERTRILHARRIGDRLTSLVDRLLVLSRTESTESGWERVAVIELVEDAVDAMPLGLGDRIGVSGEGDIDVRGDRLLLSMMLANALENALKFSAGTVRVDWSASADARVHIGVEDEGPGVSASEVERLFEPFARGPAAATARVAGHGIGLALVRHVASMHGGTARFATRHTGARLEIALPTADAPTTSAESAAARPR